MNLNKHIKPKLKFAPRQTGVYLMKNKSRKIIYIGKAKNLRKRLSTYFTKNIFRQHKTKVMVSKVIDFDYIVTRNEVEALILEDNLIKKHRPQYNIALKDDKKYPYLKIDIKNNYPKVKITRRVIRDGSKYFGPYTEAYSIRNIMNILENTFKLRTCNRIIPKSNTKESNYERPCLNFQINKCDAPCVGNISYLEYQEKIKQVILFLKGKTNLVIEQLQKKMYSFAGKKKFEEAAEIRDQIQRILRLTNKQIISKVNKEDYDIIGISRDGKICCAVIFKIREGKLIKKEHYFLENTEDEKNSVIISRFITQYYNIQEDRPKRIYLQSEPGEKILLEEFLKLKIQIPQRGDKKRIVDMAKKNAFLQVEEKKLAHLKSSHRAVFTVKELKDKLHLKKLPRKIAAFDVSNLYGTEAVASLVFFDNGKPKKGQYRRFKIKTVKGINDYEMMEEVISRYLSHLKDDNFEKPDFILIDGGKGQLNSAKKALSKTSYEIYLFSIAKRLEEIFAIDKKEPIIIPKASPALKLLQKLRDEAHRFAITYHKKLRDKKTKFSELDKIPGIGDKRKFCLLKYFKSVEQIKNSSLTELESIPGINRKIAQSILTALKK